MTTAAFDDPDPTLVPPFVPCLDAGLGTSRGAVAACATRRPVRLHVDAFVLDDRVVGVRAEVVRRTGDPHPARFSGGQIAWVRPVAATTAAAA